MTVQPRRRESPDITADPPRLLELGRRSAGHRARRDVVDVVGVLLIVIPVGIWLAQGGVAGVNDLRSGVHSLGVFCGLVGTALLCEMLLLAARIPYVDHSIGHDRAILRHRQLNVSMITLLICHGIFLVLANATALTGGLVGELWMLASVRDTALAVVSIFLFGLVGLSSAAAVRLKLPREVWHGVHLVSYIAVLAAIPHQFTAGQVFAQGPARWYWATMLLVSVFCLVCWRMILPVVTSWRQRLVVSRVQHIAPDVTCIEMTGSRLGELDVRAGQFLSFRFLAPGLWTHAHPFSASASVRNHRLRITVRALGRGTRALQQVRNGTPVFIQGPYGVFGERARSQPGLVLVGAGVGIAPIRALLEEAQVLPGRALVVLRASRPQELYLYDEIAQLCRRRHVGLVTVVGHHARGSWVSVSQPGLRLGNLAPWILHSDVYVCGPEGFMDAVHADARACGLPDEQFHDERFGL
ncbi:ferric reductase-like transmembrane domain-containing protein [Propionibacterium sp.]|uniref:ferredoxin reductase family protein n=1 Tax=Propionibacterium sp. TaxID=1977903 RepID=UPI0039EC201C